MQFIDRKAKYPGRWTMKKSDGTSEVVTLIRNDEPTVEGTPMNAETLNQLSDVAGADVARAQAEAAAQNAREIVNNAEENINSFAEVSSQKVQKDIDAKAAAALKSIPESYTELDGSVKQIRKELSDTSRGMILQVSTDENTSYSVDNIDQDYVVKVSPANAGVSISEIDQSGVQITHKFFSYVSKSGLYRLTPYSSSPIAKLRFTDMTEKSVYLYTFQMIKKSCNFFPVSISTKRNNPRKKHNFWI